MASTTYKLKEKGWTLRDTYEIKNEDDQVVYKIKGKLLSLSNKYFFQDHQGNDLLMLKKRIPSLKPKYKIFRAGEEIAVIEKKWSMWKSKFSVDIPGRNDYTISGEFWKKEFEFERKGKRVAEVSKKFWSWRDTYGVKIEEDEDHELILATVLAINLFLKAEEVEQSVGE